MDELLNLNFNEQLLILYAHGRCSISSLKKEVAVVPFFRTLPKYELGTALKFGIAVAFKENNMDTMKNGVETATFFYNKKITFQQK